MLHVNGEFKGLEWKPIKRGNSEGMYLIVSILVPSKNSVDLQLLDEWRDDVLLVGYNNPAQDTEVVSLDGKIKSVRPEDSQLLLLASEENQGVMLTISHTDMDVDPAKVSSIVAMTHEPGQIVDLRLTPLNYQKSMFEEENDDGYLDQ